MPNEPQDITRRHPVQQIERFNEIAIGQWYWIDNKKNDENDGESNKWLGCVTEIGSNYVELTGPSEQYSNSQRCTRVHLKDFERVLTLEPNAQMFIRVTFLWKRDRLGTRYRGQSDEISCMIRVPPVELLNVSVYTPGDFKLFYADPRTRADYLQWAPLLLEAEEYWAGNRKIK